MENESVNSQPGSKPIPKSQNSPWIKKVLVNRPYSGGFWPAPSTTVTLSLSHRAVQTGPLWEKLRSRSLWNKCLPLICSTTSNLSPASLGNNPPTWNGASEPVLLAVFPFPLFLLNSGKSDSQPVRPHLWIPEMTNPHPSLSHDVHCCLFYRSNVASQT